MPVCPFCGERYSPTAILTPDERLQVVNGKDGLELEVQESVEAFQCWCGAWWFEGMKDAD